MAKTVVQSTEIVQYVWWRAALLGVGLGVVFWALMALLNHYVVAVSVCQGLTTCSDSMVVSGDIATILTAFIGLLLTMAIHVYRPLIVVVAVAVVTWGLGNWVDGLSWYEALGWAALLYGLAYLLFSWVTQYQRLASVLIWTILVVVVARVIFALV